MIKAKTYVLKKEFPGGYKKGDTVSNSGTNIWYWDRTMRYCRFNPEDEPSFFALQAQPKFTKGSKVFIKPAFVENRRHNTRNIGIRTELVVDNITILSTGKISYLLKLGSKVIGSIDEDKIYAPEYYWFLNSKGVVCKDIVIDGSHPYNFRKAAGNVFPTAEEANAKLDDILNFRP